MGRWPLRLTPVPKVPLSYPTEWLLDTFNRQGFRYPRIEWQPPKRDRAYEIVGCYNVGAVICLATLAVLLLRWIL